MVLKVSKANLIDLGCSGVLRFLIDVPGDIQIGNAGWGNTEEALDPVIRTLNRQAFHLTPVPVSKPDLLILSKEDCKKLQARGTLRQAVFFEAAKFGPESQLKIISPLKPEDEPYGLGKLHFPKRVFAAYDRNILFQEPERNEIVPTKELVIIPSQLQIAATELLPYLISQEQQRSAQPLFVHTLNATVVSNKRKPRSLSNVSAIIKEIYRQATEEEKEDTDNLWQKFKGSAHQKRPPLLYTVDNEIYYEKSDGKTTGTITRKNFGDRLRDIVKKLAKDVS